MEYQIFLDYINHIAERIKELIKKKSMFHIYSHLDADGLAAAGIIAKALHREDVSFRVRILPWIDEEILNECAGEPAEVVIFSDLGSGYLDLINKAFPKKPVIILDHHPPIGKAAENIIHINPVIFGLDGTVGISGAGVAYLTMKAINPKNIDSSPIAVVGALGDLQDSFEHRRLGGLNELIVSDAKRAGLLESHQDLIFYGYETRPIHKAMAYTMTPMLPGLSGSEGNCYAFLLSIGINPKTPDGSWRALKDLTVEEKRKLASSLAEYLIAKHKTKRIPELIGEVYTLIKEPQNTPLRDGREFATLLNATGRMKRQGLGVALCMGARGIYLDEAQRLLEEYRSTIGQYLNWAVTTPGVLEEMENVYVLHGKETINDKMISVVASVLVSALPNPQKPLLAYAYVLDRNLAKFSLRTTSEVVEKGVHLGDIARELTEPLGGSGGGHNIAAGAEVPIEKVPQFLQAFNQKVKRVLQGER